MNFFPFHIGDYSASTRHLSWDEDMAYRRLLDISYSSEQPLPLDLRKVFRLVLAQTDVQREAVQVVLDEFFTRTDEGWVNGRIMREIDVMRTKQQSQRDKAAKRWGKDATALKNDATAYATASEIDAAAMPRTFSGNATSRTPAMPRTDAGNATNTNTNTNTNNPPTPQGGLESVFDEQDPNPERVAALEARTQALLDRRAARQQKSEAVDGRFEQFWSLYPKKVGKGAARKAWDKLKMSDSVFDSITRAVAEQSKSQAWTKDDGQYIPNPATWINQERWEDGSFGVIDDGKPSGVPGHPNYDWRLNPQFM